MKKDNTFNAKVDIVTRPDNIKNYSVKRKDYTELALTAIQNKASVIKYISPLYKDYSLLCEEAVNEDYNTFMFIDESASNYKELGIKSIVKNSYIVKALDEENKYYLFFWRLAISLCYKILIEIDEKKEKLFSLVEEAIKQESLAILYVNSNIPIYSELCALAFSKNSESTKYMNINFVDKELAFKIISKEPEKIKYLDNTKEFYKEACKIALSLNGKLIRNIYYPNLEKNIDSFFELINIAKNNSEEIVNYSTVLRALCIENRQRKEKIISNQDIIENNLLEEIDNEYKLLTKKYIESANDEINNRPKKQFIQNTECTIKTKTKVNKIN